MPIWAVVVAQMVSTTSLYTIITHLPMFLNGNTRGNTRPSLLFNRRFCFVDVTSWSFDQVGMLAAIPYITNALTTQLAGYLSDTLRETYKLNTTTV